MENWWHKTGLVLGCLKSNHIETEYDEILKGNNNYVYCTVMYPLQCSDIYNLKYTKHINFPLQDKSSHYQLKHYVKIITTFKQCKVLNLLAQSYITKPANKTQPSDH